MNSRHKTPEDAARFARAVSGKQGWAINPDREFVDHVVAGLATNYNRYGYFLCPCRDGDGVRSEDKDIICPCAYAAADIDEFGHCMCGLYCSKSFLESGAAASSIPDRRNVSLD